jgi:hypothetical protein
MDWLVARMKWIMLVSGALTCTMVYAAIAPQAALRSTFGESLEGPLAEIIVRNWGGLVILKRFERPDEVREFANGRFEIVRLGGLTIGRATYQPGWKWSVDVGSATGAARCTVEHVGLVVSGVAVVAFDDGHVVTLRPGDLFHVPDVPHDSWVVGNAPYVSLHFLGAQHYAAR